MRPRLEHADDANAGRRVFVTLAGMLAAGAVLVAGCGGGSAQRTVDAAQVEKGLEASLSTSAVKVQDASCPADVAVEKGATFTCSVKLSNGGTGKVTVTQQGANHYTYEFMPGSVQVPGSTVERAIEASLAAQGAANATVSCPETIIVKLNTSVTCQLSGAQGAITGEVRFTFSEANGTVDPESVKAT